MARTPLTPQNGLVSETLWDVSTALSLVERHVQRKYTFDPGEDPNYYPPLDISDIILAAE